MPAVAPLHAERFEPQIAAVPGEVLAGLGQLTDVARLGLAGAEPAAVPAEIPGIDITPRQLAVISLVSQGATINQVRKGEGLRGMSRGDVTRVEEKLQDRLDVRSTSAVVHQLIIRRILPIEFKPDEGRRGELTGRLKAPDRSTIRGYATGMPEAQIARSLGMTLNEFTKEYEPDLHRRVKAWKRPHAVRRGHELGILRLVEAPVAGRG